jgi:hypothetical protein
VVGVDFGMSIVPQLWFGPRIDRIGSSVALPFLFGVEGNVGPRVRLGFTGEGGPRISLQRDGSLTAGPWVSVLLHVGFTL